MEQADQAYDFDVAVSYAGEDREYVHEFAEHLRNHGIRIFYDEFYTAELWGRDLYEYLDTVYRERSRFAVVFISKSYVAKPWPSHERQSAQARTLNEMGPYLLPVRFDDSVLPGLRPTVSYINGIHVTPQQLASLVLDKLADAPGTISPAQLVVSIPRTPQEQHHLLTQRPPAWEYLFYASVLLQHRASVDEKWRDHEIRYAPRNGKHIDNQGVINYLSSAADEASAIVEGINLVLNSDAQELAFGAPGEAGNPEKIEHLATRLIGIYEELLDWARNLRGISVSNDLRNTFELTARLVDLPIKQIRDMVDNYAAQVQQIPERLHRRESVHLEMTLKIDMDDEALSAFVDNLSEVAKILKAT
jgi:TIR domain